MNLKTIAMNGLIGIVLAASACGPAPVNTANKTATPTATATPIVVAQSIPASKAQGTSCYVAATIDQYGDVEGRLEPRVNASDSYFPYMTRCDRPDKGQLFSISMIVPYHGTRNEKGHADERAYETIEERLEALRDQDKGVVKARFYGVMGGYAGFQVLTDINPEGNRQAYKALWNTLKEISTIPE